MAGLDNVVRKTDNTNTTGARMNRVKELRQTKGLSQMALAVATVSSTATIVYIERYQHTPGPDLRRRIAAALGCTEPEVWPDAIPGR